MTFTRAILRGFAKPLTFSGSATRAEFWWFAPIGLALPVVAVAFLSSRVCSFETLVSNLLIFVLLTFPFVAAASRRFHDTGEADLEFWRGIGPSMGVFLSGYFIFFGIFAMTTIWALPIGVLIAIPALLSLVYFLVLAPGTLGNTIGQLLLPTSPGPNRYGPNPTPIYKSGQVPFKPAG
jgi:uncharacterized membrane protein YhaH (DUF805 family)